MMTLLTNSLYYAMAERGYLCEITASTPSQAYDSDGTIFNLVVDVSDPVEGGVTETAATLYFTCKDSDLINEDGISPLFALELDNIVLGNLIYSGKRAKVNGLSRPAGSIKLEDLGSIIRIINEVYNSIVNMHDKDPEGADMWGPESRLNKYGFSLVTIAVGDYNLVTTEGRVEGFNTYIRMTHMPTSNIIIACIDEDVLTENESEFEVLSTSRLTEEKLTELLMYALPTKHQFVIKGAAKSIREKVIEDVKRACKDVLLPFVQTAMSQRLEIVIDGSEARAEVTGGTKEETKE